ncbi:hypothetical protein U1Q18_034424 [Sarracenia purpurea var. burkii]
MLKLRLLNLASVSIDLCDPHPSVRTNGLQAFSKENKMAAHKVAHATLTGPSVVKELIIGFGLGLSAGALWKMHHWNEQRKTRAFYDLLEKGVVSVVAEE